MRQPKEDEWETLKNQVPQIKLTTDTFIEKRPPAETLMQALRNNLPPKLLASVPQAFDIIGDIAVIDIPPQPQTLSKLNWRGNLANPKERQNRACQSRRISWEFTESATIPSSLANKKPKPSTANSAANTTLTLLKRIFHLGSRMNMNVWLRL